MSDSKELITIIRPSFMKFCQDGCKAAAFNHLLYWIARKGKGEPREKIQDGQVMWYATTEEITEGMSNAWGVCKVRKEVNEIIDMGIIGRGKNPKWGADRTKHFFFGPDQCAELLSLFQKHAICLYCLGLPNDVTQMINLSNANNKIMICKCEKHQMEMINLSDAIDKSIEAITKVSSKVTAKDSIKESSTALRANNDSPVAERVKETKMSLTEEEQVFWSLLCEARTLQEKRLYRELERWSKPTKLQREQITAILQKLQENGFSVRSLTPEMIEQAWIDEMEVRSYLKRDPEWKVGNLESALLTYLKQYAHVATEKPVATPVSPEDLSSTVLWTKTPHLLLGSLEQYWPILEWMPAGEARKHRYGEYEPLSAEEIECYRQLAGQQEPKRLRLL